MGRPTWMWAATAGSIATMLGAAACVDLFHSTSFATLCEADAAACSGETPDATGTPTETDPCTPPSGALKQARHACAWIGACRGALEGSAFGTCVIHAQAAYSCTLNPTLRPIGNRAHLWSCLANVTSCEEVDRCLFGVNVPVCPPVDSGSFTACSAERPSSPVIECANAGPIAVEPCALEGRTCTKVDDSKGVCAGTNGNSCEGEPRCDGTFAVACARGTLKTDVGTDCATSGAGQCVEDRAGVACAPKDSAEPCVGTSKITCLGATARSCVGGKRVAVQCAELNSPCDETDASTLDPLTACADRGSTGCSDDLDRCADGGVLRSCAQGLPFQVTCTDFGLEPCTKPVPPAVFATCGKPR